VKIDFLQDLEILLSKAEKEKPITIEDLNSKKLPVFIVEALCEMLVKLNIHYSNTTRNILQTFIDDKIAWKAFDWDYYSNKMKSRIDGMEYDGLTHRDYQAYMESIVDLCNKNFRTLVDGCKNQKTKIEADIKFFEERLANLIKSEIKPPMLEAKTPIREVVGDIVADTKKCRNDLIVSLKKLLEKKSDTSSWFISLDAKVNLLQLTSGHGIAELLKEEIQELLASPPASLSVQLVEDAKYKLKVDNCISDFKAKLGDAFSDYDLALPDLESVKLKDHFELVPTEIRIKLEDRLTLLGGEEVLKRDYALPISRIIICARPQIEAYRDKYASKFFASYYDSQKHRGASQILDEFIKIEKFIEVYDKLDPKIINESWQTISKIKKDLDNAASIATGCFFKHSGGLLCQKNGVIEKLLKQLETLEEAVKVKVGEVMRNDEKRPTYLRIRSSLT
jgi:hypothetical protein